MAGQHYGPSMYPSQLSHQLSAVDQVNVNRHTTTTTNTVSDPYQMRQQQQQQYDLRPPLPAHHPPPPPPPPLPPPQPIQHESEQQEPFAKRRRTDELPSSLNFGSQKRWTFSESQPWLDSQPKSSPRGKPLDHSSSLNDPTLRSHQLPTPQTPRFPQHASSRPEIVRSRSAEHVSSNASVANIAHDRPGSGRSFAGMTADVSQHSQSFSSYANTAHSDMWTFDYNPSDTVAQNQDKFNDKTSPRVSSSTSTPEKRATTKAENKPKFPQQTLSLEKDADQIAALIAAKRKENEANSFRQRLLQRQKEHKLQQGSRPSGSEYGSENSSSPRLDFATHLVQSKRQGDVSAMHFPAQHPDTTLQYATMAPHSPALSVQQPSPSYTVMTHPQAQMPKQRDSNRAARKESQSRNKTTTISYTGFPSPPSIYPSVLSSTPREAEFRERSGGYVQSPDVVEGGFPLSPASEFRPSSAYIPNAYPQGEYHEVRAISDDYTHRPTRHDARTRSRESFTNTGTKRKRDTATVVGEASISYDPALSGTSLQTSTVGQPGGYSTSYSTISDHYNSLTSNVQIPVPQSLQVGNMNRQTNRPYMQGTEQPQYATSVPPSQSAVGQTLPSQSGTSNSYMEPSAQFIYNAQNSGYNLYPDGRKVP